MEKEELVNNIKEWMKLDNEMNALRNEMKKRREAKKKLSESLVNVMKNNDVDSFDINDGKQILYTQNKVKSAFTRKNLSEMLLKYYDNNKDQVSDIINFISENQEVKVKENIRLKEEKKKTS